MSNVVSFIAAAFGPDARFEGRIVEEVQRMEQSGMLKALDVLFVRRTSTGELETQPGIPGRPTLVSDMIPAGQTEDALVTFPAGGSDKLPVYETAGGLDNAGIPQASHVLLAMGCTPDEARSSLRFSLGHTSTEADVSALIEAIGPVVERARAARQVRK